MAEDRALVQAARLVVRVLDADESRRDVALERSQVTTGSSPARSSTIAVRYWSITPGFDSSVPAQTASPAFTRRTGSRVSHRCYWWWHGTCWVVASPSTVAACLVSRERSPGTGHVGLDGTGLRIRRVHRMGAFGPTFNVLLISSLAGLGSGRRPRSGPTKACLSSRRCSRRKAATSVGPAAGQFRWLNFTPIWPTWLNKFRTFPRRLVPPRRDGIAPAERPATPPSGTTRICR